MKNRSNHWCETISRLNISNPEGWDLEIEVYIFDKNNVDDCITRAVRRVKDIISEEGSLSGHLKELIGGAHGRVVDTPKDFTCDNCYLEIQSPIEDRGPGGAYSFRILSFVAPRRDFTIRTIRTSR